MRRNFVQSVFLFQDLPTEVIWRSPVMWLSGFSVLLRSWPGTICLSVPGKYYLGWHSSPCSQLLVAGLWLCSLAWTVLRERTIFGIGWLTFLIADPLAAPCEDQKEGKSSVHRLCESCFRPFPQLEKGDCHVRGRALNTLTMDSLWLVLTQLYQFNEGIKSTPQESTHFLPKVSSLWCLALSLPDVYCSTTCMDRCTKCLLLTPLEFWIPGTCHAMA